MPIFRFVQNVMSKWDPKTARKRYWFLDRILEWFLIHFRAPGDSQARVRPGPAGMGWKASCFFLDQVLRSILPYALPQFKKGLSPTFALYSGQEICMVCFPSAFAYSHEDWWRTSRLTPRRRILNRFITPTLEQNSSFRFQLILQ